MKSQNILDYTAIEKLGESIHAKVFKICPNDYSGRILILKKFKPVVLIGKFTIRLKFGGVDLSDF